MLKVDIYHRHVADAPLRIVEGGGVILRVHVIQPKVRAVLGGSHYSATIVVNVVNLVIKYTNHHSGEYTGWVLICALSLFIQLSEVTYKVNKLIVKGFGILRVIHCQAIAPF